MIKQSHVTLGDSSLSTTPDDANMTHLRHADRSEEAHQQRVLQFVEQFALLLSEAGLPRMSARVFAFVLADDAEIYTARELSEGLRVSPAAVSGAVRQLVQAGLLAKERAPGSRVDHYRVYDDDIWSAIMAQRRPFITRTLDVLTEGLDVIGTERAGGRRIRETIEFYRFIEAHMWAAMEEWQKHRRRVNESTSADGDNAPDNPPHPPDTPDK
jgi:DNA-binding transcriptional regulator GbsR (MarR family)